jgi:hypothetical protein
MTRGYGEQVVVTAGETSEEADRAGIRETTGGTGTTARVVVTGVGVAMTAGVPVIEIGDGARGHSRVRVCACVCLWMCVTPNYSNWVFACACVCVPFDVCFKRVSALFPPPGFLFGSTFVHGEGAGGYVGMCVVGVL